MEEVELCMDGSYVDADRQRLVRSGPLRRISRMTKNTKSGTRRHRENDGEILSNTHFARLVNKRESLWSYTRRRLGRKVRGGAAKNRLNCEVKWLWSENPVM